MDEAGEFEGDGSDVQTKYYKRPLIFGLLVLENDRSALANQYNEIAARHGMEDFIHATALHRRGGFLPFVTALVSTLATSTMIPFVMRYESDLHSFLPDAARDAYAANRHLNMAQAAFEYLLFLHPEFWGKDLIIDFHPNSRTLPVKNDDAAKIFRDMGFKGFNVPDTGKRFVQVWNTEAIRSYLHRMLIDYSPWLNKTGQRSWALVEAIVAYKSNDPFVHWADNLAWLARSGRDTDRYSKISSELSRITTVNLTYGREHQDFRALLRLYLDRGMEELLPAAIEALPSFRASTYRNSLTYLLDSFISGSSALDVKQIESLECLADKYLRSARGNWDFVHRLLSRLVMAIDSLPEADRQGREMRQLLSRLHSHLISVYNHRGNAGQAWQSFRIIDGLSLVPETVAEFYEKAEQLNRLAVTSANVFAFDESNRLLEPLTTALEESRVPLNRASQSELTFPLLGKLWGTMGQNSAFIAPRRPNFFSDAETLFIKARDSFTIPCDRLRHEVNLLHLYLDWEKTDGEKRRMADATAQRIEESPSVSAFLAKPDPFTAPFNQFNLAVLVKHAFQRGSNFSDILEKYSLYSLKRWFGATTSEHPFEFICSYLGLAALRLERRQEGLAYLNHAITIPGTDNPEEEPTLQMIRCLIVVRWALLEQKINNKANVSGKLNVVVNKLSRIGHNPGLENILRLKDGEGPNGWFAPGWRALSAVDWNNEFSKEACETFLQCFTFNYR